MQIQRSTIDHFGNSVLNKQEVMFPEILNMQFLKGNNEGEKLEYKLCALIEHFGYMPSSGHYLAYKRFQADSEFTPAEELSCKLTFVFMSTRKLKATPFRFVGACQ